MGKYHKVREIIREVMKDGKYHTPEELEMACKFRGLDLKNNRGPIYNVVHQLKQKGEIMSDGEKGYILIVQQPIKNSFTRKEIEKIDLSEFELIKPSIRKKTKQVVSIFENGDVAFNEELVKGMEVKFCEIRLKKDCSQLIIIPNGVEKIAIGKNSRFKNYEINEKLKQRRIKFPVYYMGVWDNDKEFWLGNLCTNNPNKTITGMVNKKI